MKKIKIPKDIEKDKGKLDDFIFKESAKFVKIHQEHRKPIIKEILDIFKKKKIPVPIAYQMIKEIKNGMEEISPNLKKAELLAQFLRKKLPSQVKDDLIKKIDKYLPDFKKEVLKINNKWNNGHLSNIVCSYNSHIPSSTKTKCDLCGETVYYDKEVSDKAAVKNAKKHCVKCTLEKHSNHLNNEQKMLLQHVLDKWENK